MRAYLISFPQLNFKRLQRAHIPLINAAVWVNQIENIASTIVAWNCILHIALSSQVTRANCELLISWFVLLHWTSDFRCLVIEFCEFHFVSTYELNRTHFTHILRRTKYFFVLKKSNKKNRITKINTKLCNIGRKLCASVLIEKKNALYF